MTRDRARSLHNQKGYNLIEAAIVLGVAGLIVAAVFAAWGAVNAQSKMRRAQDQITVIVNQIRTTYGNRNTLDTATGSDFTTALVNAGLLPDSWAVTITNGNTSTSAIGNPYGGTIVVTPTSLPSSTAKDAMTITFSGLEKRDCYRLAGSMLGTGRTQGLYKIDTATVNNTSTFASIKASICTGSSLSLLFSLKAGS